MGVAAGNATLRCPTGCYRVDMSWKTARKFRQAEKRAGWAERGKLYRCDGGCGKEQHSLIKTAPRGWIRDPVRQVQEEAAPGSFLLRPAIFCSKACQERPREAAPVGISGRDA